MQCLGHTELTEGLLAVQQIAVERKRTSFRNSQLCENSVYLVEYHQGDQGVIFSFPKGKEFSSHRRKFQISKQISTKVKEAQEVGKKHKQG